MNDMAIRANKDTLAAIWVLARLKWSSRRIARVRLPTSHHTISAYYERACELREAGDLPISAMDEERKIRLRYCGDSKEVEKIDAVRNSGVCGGGRRVRPHRYNNDFRDVDEND